MDHERMSEEIRVQRKDLFSSQEQVKQARLEMEIYRQKNATRHTENAINAMRSRGGRAADMTEHHSNHYRHTRQHYEEEEEQAGPSVLPPAPSEEPRRHSRSKSPSPSPAQSQSPGRKAVTAGRVVKPRYTLPSRPQNESHVQPLGSRTSLTAMSKRARSLPDEAAFLEAEDDEEEERREGLLPHSKVSMPPRPHRPCEGQLG